MHRLCASTAIGLLVFCFVSSCGSLYVGRSITPGISTVCPLGGLPATCSFGDENFAIDYQIARQNDSDCFTLGVMATYHGSLTWQYYGNGVFTLLLIKNGVIVETVPVSPARGTLEGEIRFSRSFAANADFDAVSIAYRMDVSDKGGGIGLGMDTMDVVTGTIRSRAIR